MRKYKHPNSLMSLPPNQTILFKNFWSKMNVFLLECSLVWHTEPVCHWSQPSAQQLSDPTWSKLSSFRFQGCVNSQDDWQWQPGYQPKHSCWQKVRELQWDKDGEQGDIFLWTGSVFPLLSQERARNNSRTVQLSFFPDTNLIQIQEN